MSGDFKGHEACPVCGSLDNVGVWEDAYGNLSKYCFTQGCTYKEGSINKGYVNFPADLEYKDLNKRKLTRQTCLRYGIAFSSETTSLYFQYQVKGRITGAKVRDAKKNFTTLGKVESLFGSHLFKGYSPAIILTEGELDAASAYQMTRTPSVSIPHGADSAIKAVKQNLKYLESFKRVFVCFDNDAAGNEAADEVMSILKMGIGYRVNLDRKDANEYLMAEDTEGFNEALQLAQPETLKATYSRDELHEQWISFFAGGGDKGEVTGIPELDKHIRLRKGELTTIYANPAVGKSTLVRQIAANWVNMGKKVLICPFEELPIKYFAQVAGMTIGRRLGTDRPFTIKEQDDLFSKVAPILKLATVSPATPVADLDKLLEYGVRSDDIELVIFDNITKYTACAREQTQTIQAVLSNLVSLAQTTKCHVICVSHCARDKDLKDGVAPSMFSAFNSGAIERFSDIVITLGRRPDSDDLTVAIRKDRHGNKVGEFKIHYDPLTGCIKEATLVVETENKYQPIVPLDKYEASTQAEQMGTNESLPEAHAASERQTSLYLYKGFPIIPIKELTHGTTT